MRRRYPTLTLTSSTSLPSYSSPFHGGKLRIYIVSFRETQSRTNLYSRSDSRYAEERSTKTHTVSHNIRKRDFIIRTTPFALSQSISVTLCQKRPTPVTFFFLLFRFLPLFPDTHRRGFVLFFRWPRTGKRTSSLRFFILHESKTLPRGTPCLCLLGS